MSNKFRKPSRVTSRDIAKSASNGGYNTLRQVSWCSLLLPGGALRGSTETYKNRPRTKTGHARLLAVATFRREGAIKPNTKNRVIQTAAKRSNETISDVTIMSLNIHPLFPQLVKRNFIPTNAGDSHHFLDLPEIGCDISLKVVPISVSFPGVLGFSTEHDDGHALSGGESEEGADVGGVVVEGGRENGDGGGGHGAQGLLHGRVHARPEMLIRGRRMAAVRAGEKLLCAVVRTGY